MLGVLGLQWVDVRREMETEGRAIATAQAEMQRLRAPAIAKPDPRYASAMQAAQQLQLDLNPAFAAVENLKIAGVRLTGMSLDTKADILRLDYEMDSLAQATQVTEQLNAGFESKPWKLGGVSAAQSSLKPGPGNLAYTLGGQTQIQQGQVFKAHWSVRVSVIVQ
ncbi:hypothetical protein [Rhodoferax lacus]|nr:hypothetical protein [Rhodoferax lacus]